MTTIRRLAVLEHGDVAVRVLLAAAEFGSSGSASIETLLCHSAAEARPWWGREADALLALPEGAADDDIVAALQTAHVDTLWLGRWAGRARTDLVAACEAGGISVVGPSAALLRKAAAADLAALCPHTPWAADAPRWRVQLDALADRHGRLWLLATRDVSVAPPGQPAWLAGSLPAEQAEIESRLHAAAQLVLRELRWQGAVALRFEHDGRSLRLVEIDPVAAPDHGAAEEQRGIDAIGWRLRVHGGEALPAAQPVAASVVLQARLMADSAPARIALLSLPRGTGVRIDAHRRVGDTVLAGDRQLASITACAADRPTAVTRLRQALQRLSVVLDGAASNRTTLLQWLDDPAVACGQADLCSMASRSEAWPAPQPVVLLAAAAEAYEADGSLAQSAFFASAARGRPEAPAPFGHHIALRYRGALYSLDVFRVGAGQYAVYSGHQRADIGIERLDDYERRVHCGGHVHALLVTATADGWQIEVDGSRHSVQREDGIAMRADRPALVVAVHAKPGAVLAAGDPIAVIESMKMESHISAPTAGVVVSVAITPKMQIEAGALLLRLRPQTPVMAEGAAAPLDLAGLQQPVDFTRKACQRVYAPLANYLLGHDLSSAELRKLLVEQRRMAEIASAGDPHLLDCEDSLLDVAADLAALYRPRTEAEPDEAAPQHESTQEHLHAFLQWLDADRAGLPGDYRRALLQVLARYGVTSLARTRALEAALLNLYRSFARVAELAPVLSAILQRRLGARDALAPHIGPAMRSRLDRLITALQGRQSDIADLARDLRFHFFDEPPLEAADAAQQREMVEHLAHLARHPNDPDRPQRIERLVACPLPLRSLLLDTWRRGAANGAAASNQAVLEVHLRRFYRVAEVGAVRFGQAQAWPTAHAECRLDGQASALITSYLPLEDLPAWSLALAAQLAAVPEGHLVLLDLSVWHDGPRLDAAETAALVAPVLQRCSFARRPARIELAVMAAGATAGEPLRTRQVSFELQADGSFAEQPMYRDLHPMMARRLEIWRLREFALERRPASEDVHLFLGVARTNPADRRLFALAEVRELDAAIDPASGEVSYPRLERTGLLALAAMRSELARHAPRERPVANRLVIAVRAPWRLPAEQQRALAQRFAPLAARSGLHKVVLKVRKPAADGTLHDAVLQFEEVGHSIVVGESQAGEVPVRPLSAYHQKVLAASRIGSPYPYEITRLLTQRTGADGVPAGRFEELDLDDTQRLVPVQREAGRNSAHLVVGLITHHTAVVPEGITRVAILSDPTQGLGNLAEPECRRINAALALALERKLPVEWFAVSSGALIAMDSGTENMDWIARTLRALIEYTQAGGEVNIVVTGINVGGQPYWNAEATMLMHTKGILVMTPNSTMVLTGKQALDFSGAVSAEDNFGIGGYERIMGGNGQGQYWAASFADACALLLRHYDYCYVVPGERFPRRRPTADPVTRDVRTSAHAELPECPFQRVGDIFSPALNAERKQPFDMRSVMRAVADADDQPLERWRHLRDGDTSIVWDATIGGIPVCLLGIEAHKVARKGFVPADGPPAWTSGTLFPQSSRKTARAVNAASGNRPLVVLANLSGFDGSPESMRRRQLEYGAEIGRAVTNFDGPIVFVVISRYHGGAFVVFSKWLNDAMEIAAIEGSVASVIGGTPAAATVFAREVKQRTDADPRVAELRRQIATATGAAATRLRSAMAALSAQVRSEKLGEVAAEFDAVHSVERALRVGSVDRIIAASELRPYIVHALERGMARFAPAR